MKYLIPICAAVALLGCQPTEEPRSSSGVGKATVRVPTDPEGFTAEQRNVRERLLEDNRPGSVKHLYIISAYSGQVVLYSTVKGKVTSGGKRLSPTTIMDDCGESNTNCGGIPVNLDGHWYSTGEVLQDDGTYGSSVEYLFWWDVRGVYHQHYVSGGQIVHVSSEQIAVRNIIINLEVTGGGDGRPSATPAQVVP